MSFAICAAVAAWYALALIFVRTYKFRGDGDFFTFFCYDYELESMKWGEYQIEKSTVRPSLIGRPIIWLLSPIALPAAYIPWWLWRGFRFTFGA